MKLRFREQFICCFFAAILVVLGMYVDISPVDSSFLRGENASVSSTSYSVIRSGSYIADVDDNCTIEMLRQSTSTYQSSNYKTVAVRRFLKIAIVLLVAELFLLQRFYFGTTTDCVSIQLASCLVATIRYIHQKDGKK